MQADGTITIDRIPYRAMAGTLSAVVARWAPGSDPQRALESIADRDPSGLPEDTALTHDYLSVALEFDDGQDLTWYWSCCLPEGFSYRCPLPHWRRRETHIVVRTGTPGLGRWSDEERPVLADRRAAIGGPAPERVARAWLIAQTVPQAGHAAGEFSRIELVDGDKTLRVL